MRRTLYASVAAVLVSAFSGCGNESTIEVPLSSIDGSQFLLTAEPASVQDIIAARESVQNDEDVAVVGRIGGSVDPWIKGRAAFSLVDMSLQSCIEDGCKTPWDYCCLTHELPSSTVLVKFTDDGGQLVASDAQELLNVKELDVVVVEGKAKRDDAGNLTVIASGLFKR